MSLFAERAFRSHAGLQLNRMDRAMTKINHDRIRISDVRNEIDVFEHNLLVLSASIFRLCVSDTFQFRINKRSRHEWPLLVASYAFKCS